jgi:CheY-like chemotaxis protein
MTTVGAERRATIFVADDDDDLRWVITSLLGAHGYAVVDVSDGAAALEYLARAADGAVEMPDALLLDFAMPNLSGIGIIRTLKRFTRLPPTILMTGFPDQHVDSFAHAAGVATILHKPVDADRLLQAVAAALLPRSPATRA